MSSSGADAVALAAQAGLILDPWQEYLLEVILAERADGKWAAREAAYLVARQNGKGGVLDALCLAALFLFDDEQEILFSAHEFKTAKKAYRGIKALIQRTPHLYARVERRGTRVVGFRQSNEDTSITLDEQKLEDGTVIPAAVLRFMARSNNTARGFSPQRVIADEAQECSEDTRQALAYLIRAQANPQFVWCGTVPTPKNNGEVFKALRDRGRKGGDPNLAWIEFSPDPELVAADSAYLHSDDAVLVSNPGIPYRVTMETIDAERNAVTTDEAWAGFCREGLSWWPEDTEEAAVWGVVTEAKYLACDAKVPKDASGWLTGTPSLAVEMDRDRKVVTVAACGDTAKDKPGAQVIATLFEVSQVVPHLVALTSIEGRPFREGVVIDPASPAGSLIAPLEEAGVKVRQIKTAELVKATGSLIDAVNETALLVRRSPELDASVASSELRKYGESEFINRRSGDPSPFLAVDLAYWGHQQAADGPSVYEERGFVVLGGS